MYPHLRNVDDWHESLIIASDCRLNYAIQCNHRDQFQWRIALEELNKSRSKIYLSANGEIEGIPDKIKPNSIVYNKFKDIIKELEPINLVDLNNLNSNQSKKKRLLSDNPQIAFMIRTKMFDMDIDEETAWNLYEQGILSIKEDPKNLNVIDLTDCEVGLSSLSNKKQSINHYFHRQDSNNRKEDTIFDLTNDIDNDDSIDDSNDDDDITVRLPTPFRSLVIDLTEDIHEQTNKSQPLNGHTPLDYKVIEIPNNAKYTILVDTRERNRNNTYRDFFKNIQSISNQKAKVNAEEKQLHLKELIFDKKGI